ncbi:MAG: Hsp33 family molecular chaperone HslO [Clostridia bacterium]|nr:Hsp33 family molecular chaperone HslO [Clostridia bacterium]
MIDETRYMVTGMPENSDDDHIVRATALGGRVKACAVNSTKLTAEAMRLHNTSPVVTAALGRFMTGSLLIADSMKGKQDTQTTIIKCDGPIRGMTAVCDTCGHVRAYPIENDVESTYHKPGKLNVGEAVGKGMLTVIRDIGLREPYVGQTELMTGEIAEDFTYYLATSEQTPSIVALGVKLEEGKVTHAGGMMVQLMPGATEEDIDYLEKRVNGGFPEITYLMEEGFTPAKILDLFLGDPEIAYWDANKVSFECTCSKSKFSDSLSVLGKDELNELIKDEKGIDVECHFCNSKYHFNPSELADIINAK